MSFNSTTLAVLDAPGTTSKLQPLSRPRLFLNELTLTTSVDKGFGKYDFEVINLVKRKK